MDPGCAWCRVVYPGVLYDSVCSCRVAVKCLRELLVSVPHFNHIQDVLQALVPAAAGGDARMRADACAALATLLRSGRHGAVMLSAVQLVADLVRQRKCVCHPDVVRALLVLQFKDLTKSDVEKGVFLVCAAALSHVHARALSGSCSHRVEYSVACLCVCICVRRACMHRASASLC